MTTLVLAHPNQQWPRFQVFGIYDPTTCIGVSLPTISATAFHADRHDGFHADRSPPKWREAVGNEHREDV